MDKKSDFETKLADLLIEEYKRARSEAIKRGIQEAKRRKNENKNN